MIGILCSEMRDDGLGLSRMSTSCAATRGTYESFLANSEEAMIEMMPRPAGTGTGTMYAFTPR